MRILGTILTLAVLLSACGNSFTLGGDETCDCCGTEVRVSPGEGCFSGACDPYCGIALIDAGGPDAGPPPGTCELAEPRPIDVMCPTYVPANEPTTIPVAIGGANECYCGETIQCEVQRTGEPFELELRANLCRDSGLCDACFPFVESTCALPALEEGRWTVRDRGETAFVFDVVPAGVMPEWGLECVSARNPDILGCGVDWPPVDPVQANRVCHLDGGGAEERVTLTVTDACGGCGTIPGPCEVEVFDDILRVRPSRVESRCDIDCPEICMPVEHTCVSPPLPAGEWRVFLGNVEIGTQVRVPGPGEEPPAFEEVCGEVLGG